MVPLGLEAVGIQPTDSARPDFTAGLLGAHRIGLRTDFYSSPRLHGNSRRIAGPAGDLCSNGSTVHHANEMEIASSLITSPELVAGLRSEVKNLPLAPDAKLLRRQNKRHLV